jgi:DNA polymerase III delta prime subunit
MFNQNQEHSLWTEKYRPNQLEDYVGNDHIKKNVKHYLETDDVPNLLLVGTAGTGKTTIAKLIANNIDCDLLYLNASDTNSVDTVREQIKSFASSIGFKKWRLVICDEFDFMTPNAQAALRNLMETFSKTCRFILTGNYIERIIEPIQSRCQVYYVTPPSKKDVAIRMANILNQESIQYTPEDLVAVVNTGYPDIRKVINACQRQSTTGTLIVDTATKIEMDYMTSILEQLKNLKDKKSAFANIRQILADSKVRDFTGLYSYLYEKLDEFAVGHIGAVILIIAEHQALENQVVDREINVAAMMVKLINEL